jgi:hypothetical protein
LNLGFVPHLNLGFVPHLNLGFVPQMFCRFTELQLFKWQTNSWENWGSTLIDYAWSVQTANIVNLELSAVDPSSNLLYDKISLVQQVWYPQRCVRIYNRYDQVNKPAAHLVSQLQPVTSCHLLPACRTYVVAPCCAMAPGVGGK